MQASDEIKVISKIYARIKEDLKHISEYAVENPACNYFFFVPEEMTNKDEPDNFQTFKNMVDSLVGRVEALTPTDYSVSLHNEFWHFERQIISMDMGGGPGYIHLVFQPDNGQEYCISHSGGVWRGRNLCGKITSKGDFKSGRVSYGGLFMYDETINRIKGERELAKTPKLLRYLKSKDESKINLAVKQLFKSKSDLTIPYILQILKEWQFYETIFKSNYKDFGDLEALATSISENKAKFAKETKNKIIPFCNSTQFDVQYLAMKIMKGKWTRSDKVKLSKIRVRGNFATQLLKLEAQTKTKHPDTAILAHKLLKDKNELVRNAAVDSLGEIGGENELNDLQNIGSDTEKRDRYNPSQLIKAINKIKGRIK